MVLHETWGIRKICNAFETSMCSDLQILDSHEKPTYYKGRWKNPKTQTGIFVARRPREFGLAAIWSLVEVEDGKLIRMKDLPIVSKRWSGRDDAWHIQLAIDCELGKPQQYRLTDSNYGVKIEFFSPLPIWAERRLIAFGKKYDKKLKGSLFAYDIPSEEMKEEITFLHEQLWLKQMDDGSNEGEE